MTSLTRDHRAVRLIVVCFGRGTNFFERRTNMMQLLVILLVACCYIIEVLF